MSDEPIMLTEDQFDDIYVPSHSPKGDGYSMARKISTRCNGDGRQEHSFFGYWLPLKPWTGSPDDVFTKRGNDPGCDETVDGVDGGKANDNDRAERHV